MYAKYEKSKSNVTGDQMTRDQMTGDQMVWGSNDKGSNGLGSNGLGTNGGDQMTGHHFKYINLLLNIQHTLV